MSARVMLSGAKETYLADKTPRKAAEHAVNPQCANIVWGCFALHLGGWHEAREQARNGRLHYHHVQFACVLEVESNLRIRSLSAPLAKSAAVSPRSSATPGLAPRASSKPTASTFPL